MLLVTASVARANIVQITSCNQTVPPHSTGVMMSDLDCSLTYGTYAVVLSSSSKLLLNGYSVISDADGIHCLGKCRIAGPGAVARSLPSCTGQTVIDTYGVFGDGTVTLDHVTLQSWGYATWSSQRLRAAYVLVDGQCLGLIGNYARLSIRNSTITNNAGLGIAGSGPISITGSIVTNNFVDISSPVRPRVHGVTCQSSAGGSEAPPDTWGVCAP
jgi:hypothetical protein